MQIVSLESKRWTEYRDLRLEALRESPGAFKQSYAEEAAFLPGQWQSRLPHLLFAQHDKHLIGMIGVVPYDEDPTLAYIAAMYVTPQCRGQGAGGALVDAALHKAEAYETAILWVNDSQHAAIELYKSKGFIVVGECDAIFGDGKTHRCYEMRKELGNHKESKN